MISYRSENYMYSYNKMKPKMFSTHLHKYYEFLYFVQGDASYIVEGKEYSAQSGDLFITRPGELHSIIFKSSSDYERHFIQISEEFLQDIGIDMLQYIKSAPFGECNKIDCRLVEKSRIKSLFEGVGECVSNRRDESDLLVKTYVIQLLDCINNLLPKTDSNLPDENERIKTVKDYINSHLTENITLDKIAENAFMDKFYLCHLFHKETGFTVKDYISIQRIALAKKLIEDGNRATNVYRDCGFNDYSTFYRVFKKHSGKSPQKLFNKK